MKQDLRALDKDILTPGDVAPFLNCDPMTIRLQARKDPKMLGFPVIVMGNRVKIPRRPFVEFISRFYSYGDVTIIVKKEAKHDENDRPIQAGG